MKTYFMPLLFLGGTLFLGYLYVQDLPGVSVGEEKNGTVPYNQLQQYRQETEVKLDIKNQKVQMDKRLSGPRIDSYAKPKSNLHKTEVRKSLDPKALDLADDVSYQPIGLDQRMDEFLAKRQRYQDLERDQKLAYVEEFIREAREMGFIVIVNEQMEIESVTKAD